MLFCYIVFGQLWGVIYKGKVRIHLLKFCLITHKYTNILNSITTTKINTRISSLYHSNTRAYHLLRSKNNKMYSGPSHVIKYTARTYIIFTIESLVQRKDISIL